ncbi:MAG: hypothetical protein AAF085_04840 [Planctomycetota bacterium]
MKTDDAIQMVAEALEKHESIEPRKLASLHEGYGLLADTCADLLDTIRFNENEEHARHHAAMVALMALRIMTDCT